MDVPRAPQNDRGGPSCTCTTARQHANSGTGSEEEGGAVTNTESTWQLSLMAAATPESRDGVVVTVGSKLYLLGGYRSRSPFETHPPRGAVYAPCKWIYELGCSDQLCPEWRQLPRLTARDRKHLPRPGMIACGVQGCIYTYGGYRHDGFTGDMHRIDLSDGSCTPCDVSSQNSPLEDEFGTRLSGILWKDRWVVARRVVMPACLYFFDFGTHRWSCEEFRVEGREHGLMYVQELQTHNGHLYALNAECVSMAHHLGDGPGPCRLEVLRLEGLSWVRVDALSSDHWLQRVGVFETFFSGAVVGSWWVLWGSLSLQPNYPGDDVELLDPPELLNATSAATCVTSDWRSEYKAHPMAFNFASMSWSRISPTAAGGSMTGPAPLARRLHCVAAVPGSSAVVVVGGEVLPVPGETEMPVSCHVVERIDLPASPLRHDDLGPGGSIVLPSPSDLLDEVQSVMHEVLDDSICDVRVFAKGNPGSAVMFSAALMSQRSDVFRRMLASNMMESSQRQLEIPSVRESTVAAFRHLCHLELDALQTCLTDATTLMELHSLCHTYLVQPLGVKLTTRLIWSWFGSPDRGMEQVANFWRAIHETSLAEVYHQGIPELVAEFLLQEHPARLDLLKQNSSFQALPDGVSGSLVEYVEKTALQAQVQAMSIAGRE